MAEPTLPTRFGCILFPGFQALDTFGPLDALNTLSRERTITLSLIADTLAPVSTQTDPKHGAASTSFSQSCVPTHTFATAPPLDVLLIPGGYGTRDPSQALIEYIKTVYPSLQYVITVCTGAVLAARAGILDGRKATTNKRAFNAMAELGPKTHWIAKARWVVDGNVWTAAGVSAGIDVTFAWIEEVFGKEVCQGLVDGMEYDRHTDSSWDPFAEINNLKDILPKE